MLSFEVEHDMCGWMVRSPAPRGKRKSKNPWIPWSYSWRRHGYPGPLLIRESWWVPCPYEIPELWDSHDELWIELFFFANPCNFCKSMDMLVVFSTQLDEYHLYLGNFLGFVASMVCFQENVFPGLVPTMDWSCWKHRNFSGQIDIYQQKLFKSVRVRKTLTHLMIKIWGGFFTTHITIPNRWIPYEFMFEKMHPTNLQEIRILGWLLSQKTYPLVN